MFITDDIFQDLTKDIFACKDIDELTARKDSPAFYIIDDWHNQSISHLLAFAKSKKQLLCMVEEDGKLYWADDQFYVNRMQYAIFTESGMKKLHNEIKMMKG